MAEPQHQRPPRERLVYAAAQLVRERGVTGTGVRDVVERAGAARGSFQHYFPGGKDQLISEALDWAAGYTVDWIERYRTTTRNQTPSSLFEHLIAQWKQEFASRGFERGCPIMATAVDVTATRTDLDVPLQNALAHWENALVTALVEMRVPVRKSRRLAVIMLSSLEGAIMMARVQRSLSPLTIVGRDLGPLLDAAVPDPQP